MAEQSWKGLIYEYIQEQHVSTINNLVKDLLSQRVSLLDIVQELGPHLTSDEKHKRCGGIQLLSEILHRLPRTFLSENEVAVLVEFFCSRLKDHFTVAPHVVYGMVALSLQPSVKDDGVVTMCRSLFNEVTVQSMQQTVRHNIYTVLLNFAETRSKVLKTVEDEFLLGYIQSVDGEKDPRCLMLVFRCSKIIAKNLNIGTYAEDMFEVVACYFPIDFTPAPNDPKKITKEALVLALRDCLSASPKFAEFCYPLLLEKISSSISSAKLDAIQTLTVCVSIYGVAALREFLISLWSEMRREVLSPSGPGLEEAALSALTAIVFTLSDQPEKSECMSFCKDIFKDCKRHLTDPDLQLAYPCAKLLQAGAISCQEAANTIGSMYITLLLEQFQKLSLVEHKVVILDLLGEFLKICAKNKISLDIVSERKDGIKVLVTSHYSDQRPKLCLAAMQLGCVLQNIPDFFSKKEKGVFAEHFTDLALCSPDQSTKDMFVKAMKDMAGVDKNVVSETAIPKLIQWSENYINGVEISKTCPKELNKNLIAMLAKVACDASLAETVVPSLFRQIEILSALPPSTDNVSNCLTVCEGIQGILEGETDQTLSDQFLEQEVLQKVFKFIICDTLYDKSQSIFTNWGVIQALSYCVQLVVQKIKQGNKLVEYTLRIFQSGDISAFNDTGIVNSVNFEPLSVSSPSNQTQLIHLMSSVVCSLDKQSIITDLEKLMTALLNLACMSMHEVSATAAAKCYAGILNKLPQDSFLEETTSNIYEYTNDIVENSPQEKLSLNACRLWIWITKALVLYGHTQQDAFIEKILDWLGNPILANDVAAGFDIILREQRDIMTAGMHANIRLMFKQRFFLHTAPKIVDRFRIAQEKQRTFYLTALSHMLKHLPKQVVSTELPPLLPLLVRSLTLGNANLQISTIDTFANILTDQPKLLAPYVDDIIPTLLSLTCYKPSMKVRISALSCLGMMTVLPIDKLHPQTNTVLRGLKLGLDDHKRLVRQEAVAAISNWYLLETD